MTSLNQQHFNELTQAQIEKIFEQAQQRVEDHYLEFTGTILPHEAWALYQAGHVEIVDVRTNEERKFVGFVEGTIHIPWATGTALNRNPRFAKELESKVGKDKIILLLCRSGKRSAAAANVAFNAVLKIFITLNKALKVTWMKTIIAGYSTVGAFMDCLGAKNSFRSYSLYIF